jgi:hypothetical protein
MRWYILPFLMFQFVWHHINVASPLIQQYWGGGDNKAVNMNDLILHYPYMNLDTP